MTTKETDQELAVVYETFGDPHVKEYFKKTLGIEVSGNSYCFLGEDIHCDEYKAI